MRHDHRPYAVYTILALNVSVFILEQISGGSTNPEVLFRMGAVQRELIWQGEYWRFIAPMFLHIGFTHLLLNCVSLYNLGPIIEDWAGTYRFLFIYFLAGFGGSVACLLGHGSGGAGASGGIFGLLGGLLAVLYFQYYRDLRAVLLNPVGKQVAFWTMLNFGFGLTTGSVCNYAHFGGWITGGAACAYFSADFLHRARDARRKRWGIAGLALLLAGALYACFPFGNPRYYESGAQQAFARGDFLAAHDGYVKAMTLGDSRPGLTLNVALAAERLGRDDEALGYLESYVVLEPRHAGVWLLLAELRSKKGDAAGARAASDRASELGRLPEKD